MTEPQDGLRRGAVEGEGPAIRARWIWVLAGAAVALRLLLFLGRGGYVAFDEGWYLLLGQSLVSGDGYTLTGLRHVTLSPLFPVLAGVAGAVVGDPVWGGRLVAAVTSGLLVVPCWHVFRRVAAPPAAFLGCVLVAVAPSLAPFVAPYWIGWDLWVGAEPVAHLFLWTGVALFLRARERRGVLDWAAAGAALALGYLARPEVVIVTGLLGVVAAGAAALEAVRSDAGPALARLRPFLGPLVLTAGFVVAALPYWAYLHDVTGEWSLTGRGIRVPTWSGGAAGGEAGPPAETPSRVIEAMLWQDADVYARRLYALDPSGTRLMSDYWGVPAEAEARPGPAREGGAGSETAEGEADATPGPPSQADVPPSRPDAAPDRGSSPPGGGDGIAPPARLSLYGRALILVLPPWLWLFALLGAATPDRRRSVTEAVVAVPFLFMSAVIAFVVAVDPRTQLFLVPLLLLYASLGLLRVGGWLDAAGSRAGLRGGFFRFLVAGAAVAVLLGVDVRRLQLSLVAGSPHHIVAEGNRRVGRALREIVPEEGMVMSWHPAIALYARREWRVLPFAPLSDVLRFAHATGTPHVVLSEYYPPHVLEEMPARYLILRIAGEGAREVLHIRIEIVRRDGEWALAEVREEEASARSEGEEESTREAGRSDPPAESTDGGR